MTLWLKLFYEFAKIGLFAIGGGLASLPFIYELADHTGWIDTYDIANMVAVSESTPGPLGINMATYVGFMTTGIMGSLAATFGLIMPSIIIIEIIAAFLKHFQDNHYVKSFFEGIRPAAVALITVAWIGIINIAFFDNQIHFGIFTFNNEMLSFIVRLLNYKKIIYLIVLLIFIKKIQKHPIPAIFISAVLGIVCQLAI